MRGPASISNLGGLLPVCFVVTLLYHWSHKDGNLWFGFQVTCDFYLFWDWRGGVSCLHLTRGVVLDGLVIVCCLVYDPWKGVMRRQSIIDSLLLWFKLKWWWPIFPYVLWANTILKCWDAVLAKVKLSLTCDVCMELRNSPIFNATENSSCILIMRLFAKLCCLRTATTIFQ